MTPDLIAAFLLGLISAGHCLGMCGGLMVAAGMNANTPVIAAGYNLGRLFSYLTLGITFGALSATLPSAFFPALKILSAILLILAALYLLGVNHWLTKIEKIGLPLWKITQPVAKKFLPVTSLRSALLLGYFWGFIPCGLVYTALAFSLSQQSPIGSGLSMLAFGLGTFPAMMGISLVANRARQWLSLMWVKIVLASAMLGFSAYILIDIAQQV